MKIANVKSIIAEGMTAVAVAGAVMLAVPAKANAQGFAIEVGHPYGFYHPGFYERQRAEEFRRHEAFVRHEEWERAHAFRGHYGYYR